MSAVRELWYAADGGPAAPMPEAERVFEDVVRRWPDHPHANRYYLHAVRIVEHAIPSAQRPSGAVPPGRPHRGPIWLRTGATSSPRHSTSAPALQDGE
jgi:hypothetical protein